MLRYLLGLPGPELRIRYHESDSLSRTLYRFGATSN